MDVGVNRSDSTQNSTNIFDGTGFYQIQANKHTEK